MLTFIVWLVLAVISLPLALVALLLWPVVWVLSIPFRLVGLSVRGVLDLVKAVVTLPARLLGGGRRP